MFDNIMWGMLEPTYALAPFGEDKDPPATFVDRHAFQPRIGELEVAARASDWAAVEALLDKISAYRWRSFLRGVTRSNAIARFAHLAEAQGLKRDLPVNQPCR